MDMKLSGVYYNFYRILVEIRLFPMAVLCATIALYLPVRGSTSV